ncbi:unnamed protein product [Penicillium glandicola]
MPQRKRDKFLSFIHWHKIYEYYRPAANKANVSGCQSTEGELQNIANDRLEAQRSVSSSSAHDRVGSLWDQAYKQLGSEEKELVERYEKILSIKLPKGKSGEPDNVKNIVCQDDKSGEPDNVKNIVCQDDEGREKQMKLLMSVGLERIKSLQKIEDRMAPAVNVVASFRQTVSGAISAFTVPALAWCAVCIGLELVLNSINEAESYRAGMEYVISRMKWYSSLPLRIREKPTVQAENFAESQLNLEEEVLGLFKALLKHLIKIVCTLFRHKFFTVARNVVKFDDWEGAIEEIKALEESVNEHSVHLDTRQINFHAGTLVSLEVSRQDRDFIERFWVKDMTNEIQNIQQERGKLQEACYKWIIHTQEYKSLVDWHQDQKARLVWIRGDAGKGKTMLLIGLVNELNTHVDTHFGEMMLSYFFCKGTDSSVNSAISVLRGLVWMILRQKTSLIADFREQLQGYDLNALRESSTFPAIKEAFLSMLRHPDLGRVYLVVDALDECKSDLDQLLELIRESSELANVRWIFASRNEPFIEERLHSITVETQLSLELNAESVSEAVRQFIKLKVSELEDIYRRRHNDPRISARLMIILEKIENQLHEKAEKTFLWVALVMRQLQECSPDKVLDRLALFPKGLSGVYTTMLKKMQEDHSEDVMDCGKVLLTMVNALRPLHLSELVMLANLNELAYHQRIVRQCGLLVFRDDNKTVQFVHQSAKDYLVQDLSRPDQASDEVTVKVLHEIFPGGHAEGHRLITQNSLEAMEHLKKDIFKLQKPGYNIEDIRIPDQDPLEPLRYSCQYWVDHLGQVEPNLDKIEIGTSNLIRQFLNAHFLHWVEALSLMQKYSVAISSISRLLQMLTDSSVEPEYLAQVEDFHRFVLANRLPIESFPLQIYFSAIMFSPTKVQRRFQNDIYHSITLKSPMEPEWNACIQTIEYRNAGAIGWGVSPDCKIFATSFEEARIWDFETGRLLKSFDIRNSVHGHNKATDFALSSDERLSMIDDVGNISVWDLSDDKFLEVFSKSNEKILSICYTSDDYLVTGHAGKAVIKIWAGDGSCLKRLQGHNDDVNFIAALSGGKVVSGSDDNVIKVWDPTHDWKCVRTIKCSNDLKGIAASRDNELFAAAMGEEATSASHTIQIWSATDGSSLFSVDCRNLLSTSFILGPGKTIVSVTTEGTIEIWNIEGQHVQTLGRHSNKKSISLVTLPNGEVASGGGDDQVVKVWSTSGPGKSLKSHGPRIDHLFQSPDGSSLLSTCENGLVKVWNMNGECIKTCHSQPHMSCLAYSQDEKAVFWALETGEMKVLRLGKGDVVNLKMPRLDTTLEVNFFSGGPMAAFASNGELAVLYQAPYPKVWIFDSDGNQISFFEPFGKVESRDPRGDYKACHLCFSSNGSLIAICSSGCIKLFEINGTSIGVIPTKLPHLTYPCNPMFCQMFFSLDDEFIIFLPDLILEKAEMWDWRKAQGLGECSLEKVLPHLPTYLKHRNHVFYPGEQWLGWRGQKLIWLPNEYRSSHVHHQQSTHDGFALATICGRVLTFHVATDDDLCKEFHGLLQGPKSENNHEAAGQACTLDSLS